MPTRTPPPPELRQFNVEIQFLLKSKNPHARSLLSFIKRTLRQFHLENAYTETDIFSQAYLRGVTLTESGTEIKRATAWMRATAFNIIRELSRSHRRYQCLEYDELAESDQAKLEIASLQAGEGLVSEEVIEADIQAVLESLQELGSRDRKIIELRVVENLAWREIGDHLIISGEKSQNDAALRKQGQRALERFRKLYHQKRPSQSS